MEREGWERPGVMDLGRGELVLDGVLEAREAALRGDDDDFRLVFQNLNRSKIQERREMRRRGGRRREGRGAEETECFVERTEGSSARWVVWDSKWSSSCSTAMLVS